MFSDVYAGQDPDEPLLMTNQNTKGTTATGKYKIVNYLGRCPF
jgi:hypothetical protein